MKELGGARRLREIAASEKQQIKALVSHLAQAEGGVGNLRLLPIHIGAWHEGFSGMNSKVKKVTRPGVYSIGAAVRRLYWSVHHEN